LRLTIWKTEFRLDLDLNIWGLEVTCVELDDLGIYVGPLNIQVETDKMFDVNFPPGVPTLRVFFPADRSVQRWPPRWIAMRLETMWTTDDRVSRCPL
jgi:hypothetical protein